MSDQKYHLVHVNIAHALYPLDDPRMADFLTLADEIDALAQRSAGFISQPDLPDAGAVYHFPLLLNLSVWEAIEQLETFVYESRHMHALDQRRRWFKPQAAPNYVLFWLPADTFPTEQEVQTRLAYLDQHGPTPHAFTFKQAFTVEEMLAYTIKVNQEKNI